jgi:hypothetical protein
MGLFTNVTMVLAVVVSILMGQSFLGLLGLGYTEFPAIDRINESELTLDNWRDSYLRKTVPLVIVHDSTSTSTSPGTGTGALVKRQLLAQCAADEVNLKYGNGLMDTFVAANSASKWGSPVLGTLSLFMRFFNGVDLDEWKETRQMPLEQLANLVASPPPVSSSFGLLAKVRDSLLPATLAVLIKLASHPPFLGNTRPVSVCDKALNVASIEGFDFAQQVKQETNLETQVSEQLSALRLGSLKSAAAFFWGSPSPASSEMLPLHIDSDFSDRFETMWAGCKEFVIVAPGTPEERASLHRVEWVGSSIWSDDLFTLGKPKGVEAWRGTVKEGETLYLPGGMIYEARSACVDTMSLSRRPWRDENSLNRKSFDEMKEQTKSRQVFERSRMHRWHKQVMLIISGIRFVMGTGDENTFGSSF